MARTGTDNRETFLVEHYRPGLSADDLGSWAARMRRTAGEMELEGMAVHYLRGTIVPKDESLLCLFEAESEQLVREAYTRAGIPFELISAVISEPTWSEEPHSTKEER